MKRIICLLILTACTSNEANHIGNPLLIPIRGVSAGLGNAQYNLKRERIKSFISANHYDILNDIRTNGGPKLFAAYEMVGISPIKRRKLTQEFRSDPKLYLGAEIEPIVVALMVHADE